MKAVNILSAYFRNQQKALKFLICGSSLSCPQIGTIGPEIDLDILFLGQFNNPGEE